MTDLQAQFGNIDIYLFDQLLRGRITPDMTVLDAGCGGGRNLVYFLRNGYSVLGADADHSAITAVRRLARDLAPDTPPDAFRAESVESMSFNDAAADVVISSAVLHFARDESHFREMLRGTWRVLRPGGLFFCRLAGLAGQEHAARPLGRGRYALPDGSQRFLADEQLLLAATRSLGGELLDPLKTTIVHGQRSMTTWVVRRDPVPG
jgi:tellurite methyltransferase